MYAKKKKYDNGGKVTGARTNRRGGSKEDYLRGAKAAMDYMGGLQSHNERYASNPRLYGDRRETGGQKEAISQALRFQEEFGRGLYNINPDKDFSSGPTPTAFETGINDMMRAAGSSVTGLDASGDTRLTPIQVEEILMSLPKKELKYGKGGTVKYRSGGMMKYEQGGPVGSASSDQKFRVIPEKSPTGQTELAYYIDGRPVDSQDFQQQFYDAGNKPQDLNQLIENSVIASKQGIGADSGIPSGSPLEGLMKQYRDALKERNVYREKGAAGVDSLYSARDENYDRMIRQMGG
jgi:hypothetical protein